MKNSEHLALFLLGVVTLGITFLLLFALGGMNSSTLPEVVRQAQIPAQQAFAVPLPQTLVPASMEALDREVEETFAKTAAYLAHGRFEETEHISLLERLEFYRGLSSIKPELKKTAHALVKDMDLLLTLRESVARQVKLSGQINAAVTDAQIHLAEGKRDKAVAQKIIDRIESLYAVQGLSESQNTKLRTSLAALSKVYKATDRSTARTTKRSSARTPAPSGQSDIPDTLKPYLNNAKPSATKEVTQKVSEPKVEPKPERKPVADVPVVAPAPKINKEPNPRITGKYYKLYSKVSYYIQVGKYDQLQHVKLTEDLNELSDSADSLSELHRMRLRQAVKRMKEIDQAKGFKGAWGSSK